MKRRMLIPATALALLAGVCPAIAQTPSPIDPVLHSFPGSVPGTTSAASTGLAFADRWLADEPFLNPAMAPARALSLSPLFESVRRQDLRAHNRQYDDTPYVDASGGWGALAAGPVTVAVYGWQPVLRLEDVAFIRGDEGTSPAVITSLSSQRETRAGVALSTARGAWRFGVAGEWTRREDDFQYEEVSGVPDPGFREVLMSGTGIGGAIGVRGDVKVLHGKALTVGAALRLVPALALSGTQTIDLLSGTNTVDFGVDRGSAVEYGVSARLALAPAVRLSAQAGGSGEQAWTAALGAVPAVVGYRPPWQGVAAGATAQWSMGLEYAEPDQPLTIRFGGGQQVQTRVPEGHAGVYALGLGWRFDDTITTDLGVIRRTFARPDKATSYDDRVVASLVLHF
jgi:hypothetical protein